ncbi:MAG: hypothetical protein AAGC96_17735 [Pseudomonadota bacterium]
MLRSVSILLLAILMLSAPVFADGDTRLAELKQNAELFGFVSAGANHCDNLTLADIPEVRRAIQVLSSNQLVSRDFEKTNTMTIEGIERDREHSCAMLARNFHWFYQETRD